MQTTDYREYPEVFMMMSKFVIDHKRHNDDKLLDESLKKKELSPKRNKKIV
jgi:hypothetical protein